MFLAIFTIYWYAGFVWAALLIFSTIFCPNYTRLGGFVGNTAHMRYAFCVVFGVFSLICAGLSTTAAVLRWMTVINHGCKNWEFVDECSIQSVYTAIYFSITTLLLLVSTGIITVLVYNFRYQVGDIIEKFLVQERDIEKVMQAARTGRVKEKRTAAYELAAMAASSDDNKFRIVAEGGLDVLMTMALSRDDATQEHAVEAIAELLTIPSIQDTYVDMGGVRSMSALLHSPFPRVMEEAAMALHTIVTEQVEDNRSSLVVDHGLNDLSHAAEHGTIYCQRTIASIFLELACNSDIRVQILASVASVKALVNLCQSNDPDTQRFALQTLELLAIENPDIICAQEELLDSLLDLPIRTMDEKVYLLAGKVLLYFAENRLTCRSLMDKPNLRSALSVFGQSQDPILQKVVAKIIYFMLVTAEMKSKAQNLNLSDILTYIRDHAADRDTYDNADQALQILTSDDSSLPVLPTLSTHEKLAKMKDGRFGSRSSLTPSSTGSTSSLNKGIA